MTISLPVFGRNSCSRKSFHAFPILSHTAAEECRSNKISWTSIPQRSQDARSRPFHNECNVLCVECLPTLVLRAPAQNLSQHMKVAQATIGSVGWISVAPDCGTPNLEKLATSMRAPHLLLLLPSIARLGQSHPHYLPTSDQATIYLKQFKNHPKTSAESPMEVDNLRKAAKNLPEISDPTEVQTLSHLLFQESTVCPENGTPQLRISVGYIQAFREGI